MKNISLLLNAILVIAVLFLFVKVYSEKPAVQVVSNTSKKEARIVYLSSDSLLDNYPLMKKMEKTFNNKRDSLERILQARDKGLKQEYAQFEQQAASMPEAQAQQAYEGFMRKQQELEKLRDDLLKNLSAEQESMQDSIHKNLISYLKDYNRSHGYDYIMSYQRGSGILLANDSLEITQDVLKGMKEKNDK